MKYPSTTFLLLLLLVAVATPSAHAQSGNTRNLATPSPEAVRYEYCEVRVVGKDVYADFGYGPEKLGGPELSKLEVGKLQVFATPISALNYMGSLGWEVIQGVQSSPFDISKQGPSGNRYYVLRRVRSSTGVNVTR
ncbi:hypothetical protein F0P96_17625 [Hymenobacter busanensis]|uniref:Uncharacterized protein n=1 Tax=Hymenobacter busanensis TaxID=2607656 RepID=A0A7L5A457_9BACT|nr:hypothetical protein [Hymenobacter busanensis]KAA9327061.1 hypothetical protein F0P96_17625 [Hymenobacter busanensis]QHJ09512.1 hypothetical protein GUY19_20440 [Hymenobacter busanensis]